MKENEACCKDKCKKMGKGGPSGAFYGLGFIGALFYFIQHATTFWGGVIGIFKAIFWPALVAYRLLEFFKF
jgi:hypothetical protein